MAPHFVASALECIPRPLQAVWLQAYVQQLGASAAVAAAVAAASGVNPLAAAQQAYFGGLGGFPGVPNPPVLPQKKQSPGPPGANLFILHLPFDWGENELRGAFAPFGPIMSAMVFIDRVTGLSKGFGFVSYNNPGAVSGLLLAALPAEPLTACMHHKYVHAPSLWCIQMHAKSIVHLKIRKCTGCTQKRV